MIKSVEEASRLIQDPRSAKMNILLVMKSPADAARLLRLLPDKTLIERINIGNSGRIDKGNKEMMTREVYVDETDIEAIQEILSYELPFDIQMIPTNNKVNVKDALRSIRK